MWDPKLFVTSSKNNEIWKTLQTFDELFFLKTTHVPTYAPIIRRTMERMLQKKLLMIFGFAVLRFYLMSKVFPNNFADAYNNKAYALFSSRRLR